MEEEIINIATLTIDSEKAVGTIEQTKKSIWDLQKSNTELRKEIKANGDVTGEQTKQFVEQEAEIKRLNSVYRVQQNAINEVTLAQVKESAAIKENAKTIDQANTQNKELLKTRNQLDASTTEGAQAIDLLNKKIDQNNNFIKSNSSELEKQKSNVGNYKSALEGVDSVLAQFGINGQQARTIVSGFSSTVSKAGSDIVDYSNSAIKATASTLGFKTSSQLAAQTQAVQTATTEAQTVANAGLATTTAGVTTATTASTIGLKAFTVALASTGIGLIVIALGALFSYLKDLDPLLDKIEQGFAAVGAVVRVLGSAIASLSFDGLGESMSRAASEAVKLKEAQQDLADLQNTQEVANAKASQQYDELILKSKNRTLTDKERIAFLQKAEQIETANYKQRQGLATAELNQAIKNAEIKGQLSNQEIANLRKNTLAYGTYLLNTGKITSADLELLKKGELGKIAIDAESTKRLEKNQNAQDKLFEDAQAKREKDEQKRQELATKENQRKLKSLNDSLIVFETEKHSADEQLEFYIQYYEKLNKLQGGSDKIKNAQEFSSKILEIAKTQIDSEIELQSKLIESKKSISEQEQKDLLANAEFLKQTETKRIENSLLNERDKNLALEEIQKGFLENVSTINKTFEDSEKARKEEQKALDSLDFEMRLLTLEEQGYSELELKKRILEEEHAEKLRLISLQIDSEGNLTKEAVKQKEIEDKKYAKATKEIDKELAKTKRAAVAGIAADAIAAAQSIFGESKALAVASSLINTYQGITAVWAAPSTLPSPFDTAAKIANTAVVAASGFASVKNILKTNKGSSSMDSSAAGGATAGTQTFENPAKTQTIAQLQTPPVTATNQTQTVLVLETLDEAKNNQQIKIKSN